MTADRAARFAAAYAALWAAHDLADHVVQTDHQAANKATSWQAMAGHVGGYHAVQLAAVALLRTVGMRPAWWRILAATAWSAGTHALLDRRWPVRALLAATGSGRFASGQWTLPESLVMTETPAQADQRIARADGPTWRTLLGHLQERELPVPLHGPYLADQALHHAAIAVTAAILAGGAP